MRFERYARLVLLALVLTLPAQLGNSCSSGGGGPSAPNASLVLQELVSVPFQQGFVSLVRVYADATLEYQAYDVDLSWTPADPNMFAGLYRVRDFSDDLALVRVPDFDQVAGTLTGMLDARHGPDSAVSGAMLLADMYLLSLAGDPVSITASGVLVRPDGLKFATASSPPLLLSGP